MIIVISAYYTLSMLQMQEYLLIIPSKIAKTGVSKAYSGKVHFSFSTRSFLR